jgi:ATP-binding cassette, subfamily C (CFTR/MRP), member 1
MMFLPRALSNTADAQNALERLIELFHADIMTNTPYNVDPEQKHGIVVENATFEWEVTEKQAEIHTDAASERKDVSMDTLAEPFRLANISMVVPKGSLVGIVGPVGSGKVRFCLACTASSSSQAIQSSLLQGIIGEMRKTGGMVSFGGQIAYCSQVPWIQNATLVGEL